MILSHRGCVEDLRIQNPNVRMQSVVSPFEVHLVAED